ncbi:nucleotidyltransferase domain-containing protein [Pseudaestuariivita rosea]|uniref:nucleotidyltransferase domain-containing protein n=1 Tax=Pseudaestuariivita rosea TaxID=2763263 RepID=UPI001ABBA1FF|nr:nucleotidyltransferase domain-containing protein [Pseudaestuariivita rosea]
MHKSETIQIISEAVKDVAGVKALFLSGSYGNGCADTFSDFDFLIVTDGGATEEIAEAWRKAVSRISEIVLWRDRLAAPVLINAITQDWTRIDLLILKADQLSAYSKDNLQVLFDHEGVYDQLPDTAPLNDPDPKKFRYQIEEFIRILGLLHVVEGREDYINGVLGVFHLRNLLVELLIEETNAPNRGGALHLNRLITDKQKELLKSLPAPIAERDAIIKAHLAYAKAYLPIARKRAKALEIEWPERFEEATWTKLRESVSINCPYSTNQAAP